MMTRSVPQISAIALGVAALVSLSPLSMARADPPATPASSAPVPAPSPASAPSAAAPSLSEPAPTPAWAESGPTRTTGAQHAAVRHYTHRHYAYRNGHRYYSDNPVATTATGVAGGVADLGSIAAYPFYCFPNYGSCSVRVPYRY
jgi:hypothetical protein